MDAEDEVISLENEASDEEEKDTEWEMASKKPRKAKEHMDQLQRLKQKDPEFYQFLQEHDKELLEFRDEDTDDDVGSNVEGGEMQEDDEIRELDVQPEVETPTRVITSVMVDSWCNSVRKDKKLSAISSLIKAFRTACHYGDAAEDDSSAKLSIMSSSVFNKVMVFVLNEMDVLLRGLLKLPPHGGKKETVKDLMTTKQWKKYNHLVKAYLGNSLHILNQMTDTQMISFTIRRLKYSSIFLAAFPSLLRKYIKVILNLWGTRGGALPVVSFLFLRDLCIRLGSDCIDECFKGIYKAYVLNCQSINSAKLQHVQLLRNCVIELLGVDIPTAYQHAFVYIRQLAMILHEALNMKTKEASQKVYEWRFVLCLELWVGAICAYSSEPGFKPLAYPLTQIISGVARLVPTARYFPLRLRCIRLLNQIATSTDTFIPVSMLLLDMLEMKELKRPPTGGVGKAVDLRTILKVSKPIVKTRAFQEACVLSVIQELAEHLAQWSYSIAFFELSFIPAVRLRGFCKTNKVERFRKEIRQLVRQIEANSQFTNTRRMSISFLPSDPLASSFLEDEKKLGASPMSQYVATLRQQMQQRNESLMESSVLVGEHSSVFGSKFGENDEEGDTEDGAAVFSSSWLPGGVPKAENSKRKKKKPEIKQNKATALDEDVVEDLIISSDEYGSESDVPSEKSCGVNAASRKRQNRMDVGSHARKSKKRKKVN